MLAQARKATTASEVLARYAATLSPMPTPIPLSLAARALDFFSSSCQLIVLSLLRSALEIIAIPSFLPSNTFLVKLTSDPSNHTAPGIFLSGRTG
jgi:hypothetical protein